MPATDEEVLVGETPVRLRRSWWTGAAWIDAPGQRIALQLATQIETHLSVRLTKTWRCTIDGHEVEIVRTRPMVLAGFRKCRYAVSVDGLPSCEFTAY
jgi:hypothetical protein